MSEQSEGKDSVHLTPAVPTRDLPPAPAKSERAYSVKEIDALRNACETRWLFGTTALGREMRTSRCYRHEDKAIGVEQMVRTYMLAGIVAADIYAADRPEPVEGSSQTRPTDEKEVLPSSSESSEAA